MNMQDIIGAVTRVAGVTAAAITDYEGIPIEAQATVGLLSDEQLCAWAAEMGRLAAATTEAWEGGPLQVAVFESSMGSLMLADVGKGYLVISSDPTVNAGRLRLEAERAAEALRRLLSVGLLPSHAEERAAV